MSELHSYRFAVQRVVAAVITHDPDPPRPPLRRGGVTALAGLLVAAVALAAAAAYGLVTGHTRTSPTDPGAILLDRVSGTRYVFLPADGRLHPVLNYTSGLLLAQAERPELRSVRPEKLAAVPLGEPLGIPGAPDSLPAAGDLLTGAWSLCTAGGGTTVLVGAAPAGRAETGGLLVRDGSGRTHLIAEGRRLLIPTGAERALGWFGRRPWQVPSGWAEAIPAGPALTAPEIPEEGGPSVIAGRQIGQVVTDGDQFAVVLRDGIAPLTALQARLLAPATMIGEEFRSLPASASEAGFAPGLPADIPQLSDTPASACVTLAGDDLPALVRVNAPFASSSPISVARGHGAIVTTDGHDVHLVTDAGLRFELASRDLLGRFGYAGVSPLRVPERLLAYLPAGPALDPVRAGRA
ncbi:type VII secretion protein EccB [Actinoplanes sp. OR16]|uniref:type VII secretion protein EccB n=1 Tax=Actinoplanes sp. OR16 TaxID=946334 RepID=UPI000F70161E|nr:type VII secretion protein EccB [Actinoplanes sp. OR16]BBH65337.1 type VII secretion protein EccB [Actinoplanes sp. OR16]